MACFDTLAATAVEDEILILTTPSSQVRDKLERGYRVLIQSVVEDVAGQNLGVSVLVRSPEVAQDSNGVAFSPPVLPSARPAPTGGYNGGPPMSNSADNGGTRPGEDILNARYTFDAFVIGSSNRFAHAAARSVAETPASAYNPLFIYGESGLGKTHLLHSIGNYVRENFPASHVRYVSTEMFMNEFVESIRNNTGLNFKRRYRACDVLLVDDIQFIENKESLQEEFFHTFNSLHEASKQIVLTSDRHPRFIATLEDRLRSRFASGVITDIQPPELETRIAILRKKAEGERPHVPDEVLELIATHVKDNIRELEGALIRVSAFASLNREPLTVELAEQVLSDILAADQPRQITPKVILEATASTFGFTVDELCGTSRRRPLVNARQISMYVFRELTDFSYPAIAREFGGRDHTTVIHAVAKISQLMKERRQVYDQATQLIQRVKGGG
jgi:chromosomal replication initiator protein